MGKKTTVEVLVEGGKATAGPPLGSTLGPLKVNVGQIVAQINEKTKEFKGMKVPAKVTIDEETKAFEISIGTPPASQLIKKEINLELGSGEPNRLKAAAISFEQIIKVAKMKMDSLLVKDLKGAVKTMVGSCQSLGVLVDGKEAPVILQAIDNGEYDNLISAGKTEPTSEKKAEMEALSKELAANMERAKKKKAEEKAQAEAEKAAKAAAAGATATPAPGAAPAATPSAAPASGKPAAATKPAAPAKK